MRGEKKMQDDLILEEEDVILPDGWTEDTDILNGFADEEEETIPTDDPQQAPIEQQDVPPADDSHQEDKADGEQEVLEEIKPKIKIKYNHEEKELSIDEAAPYVQKGMHYDKIEGTVKEANKLAKEMGFTSMNEMISSMRENYINAKVQDLVDDGVHEAVARKLVTDDLREAESRQAAEEAEAEAKRAADEQTRVAKARDEDVSAFVKAYPGVTVLPEEVKAANANGIPLVVAYAQYQARQAQIELQQLKQNQNTASRAPVGGVTKHGGIADQASDPFMDGFDSDSW